MSLLQQPSRSRRPDRTQSVVSFTERDEQCDGPQTEHIPPSLRATAAQHGHVPIGPEEIALRQQQQQQQQQQGTSGATVVAQRALADHERSRSVSKSPDLKGDDLQNTFSEVTKHPHDVRTASFDIGDPRDPGSPPVSYTSDAETRSSPASALATRNSSSVKLGSGPGSTSPATATTGGGSTDKYHILVAATGSVATIKIPLIIQKLRQIYKDRAEIQLVLTKPAETFLKGVKLPADLKVWRDEDEWSSRQQPHAGILGNDLVLHVKLRRWADIMLIAPLSANTLAKIANGICNNLLTSVIRSWNPLVPILVAPAMNTHMYTNPMTKKHLQLLKDEYPWVETLKPVEKVLVCGDIGMGGMREWADVVHSLVKRLGIPGNDDDDDDDDDDEDNDEDNEDGNDDEDADSDEGTDDDKDEKKIERSEGSKDDDDLSVKSI